MAGLKIRTLTGPANATGIGAWTGALTLPAGADPALTNLLVRDNFFGTNAASEPFLLRHQVGIDLVNGDQVSFFNNIIASLLFLLILIV